MIIDAQNSFTHIAATGVRDQVITATARSTNTIDLGVLGLSKGDKPVDVLVQVTGDMDAAGAATLKCDLVTDADADCSDGDIVNSSAIIPKASLVAGYQFSFSFIPVNCQRYVDLNFTVATGPFVVDGDNPCTIMAGLILDRQTNNA